MCLSITKKFYFNVYKLTNSWFYNLRMFIFWKIDQFGWIFFCVFDIANKCYSNNFIKTGDFFYIPFGHFLNFPPKSAQKEDFFFEFLGFKMEFYYANGPSWEKKLLWKKFFFYSKLKVLLLCLKHNCTFLENEPTEYFRFGVSELPMGRAFKILHVSSGSFFSGQTPFQTSCEILSAVM